MIILDVYNHYKNRHTTIKFDYAVTSLEFFEVKHSDSRYDCPDFQDNRSALYYLKDELHIQLHHKPDNRNILCDRRKEIDELKNFRECDDYIIKHSLTDKILFKVSNKDVENVFKS